MTQTLAVIGGSGLYQMPGLTDVDEVRVETPWGDPSDAVIRGRLGGTSLLFLPRHGRGHRLSPSNINYRANLWALKKLGATHVLSVSAVGSLREEIVPGHLVVVDQFIDRTRQRASTFFDEGVVAHVSVADPVCPVFARAVAARARGIGATVHEGGTYVCIEGPRFSTRAESHTWRAWNAAVVGMTNVPEAFLARECELPYATLALATDYDCWRAHDEVDVTSILAVIRDNVARAQSVVRALAEDMPDVAASPAHGALRHAVMTAPSAITEAQRARYALLLPHLGRDAG
ncbi:MAG: S-methyl-5'-thioadenosine phosphorylase [Polyangiales bacterium]